ncbi:hypothetical protein EJB05_34445, partial [Eragrostis curvula]
VRSWPLRCTSLPIAVVRSSLILSPSREPSSTRRDHRPLASLLSRRNRRPHRPLTSRPSRRLLPSLSLLPLGAAFRRGAALLPNAARLAQAAAPLFGRGRSQAAGNNGYLPARRSDRLILRPCCQSASALAVFPCMRPQRQILFRSPCFREWIEEATSRLLVLSVVELQRVNCLILPLFPAPSVIFHKIQILLESFGTSSANGRRKCTQPLSVWSNLAPADGTVLDQVLPICGDDFCADTSHWDSSLIAMVTIEPSPTDDGVPDGVLCSRGDYFPIDFRFSSICSVR